MSIDDSAVLRRLARAIVAERPCGPPGPSLHGNQKDSPKCHQRLGHPHQDRYPDSRGQNLLGLHLTNDSGTLYVGVTSALEQGVIQHHLRLAGGFTKKYHHHRLVHYEATPDVRVALEREKQIKRWRREKKVAPVRTLKPKWRDLASDLRIAASS